ncbi:MAG: MerR family transcriptional regulator [Deltaproteobacteria bacterium]|nr:MerR family transcriptional regulator [Deltaproteobacteria bacterium]
MKIFCKKAVIALTGVSYKQLDHWAVTGLIRPSVKAAKGNGSRRKYSFRDLVQIRVAKGLKGEGMSLQKIRSALIYLRKHFPDTEAPLAQLKFVTNGSDIFVLDKDSQKVPDALNGQFVFSLGPGRTYRRTPGGSAPTCLPKRRKVPGWRQGLCRDTGHGQGAGEEIYCRVQRGFESRGAWGNRTAGS